MYIRDRLAATKHAVISVAWEHLDFQLYCRKANESVFPQISPRAVWVKRCVGLCEYVNEGTCVPTETKVRHIPVSTVIFLSTLSWISSILDPLTKFEKENAELRNFDCP